MAVLKKLWLQTILLLISATVLGQQPLVQVKGTVYDITRRNPMESVTVMATNGQATMTDTLGHYKIWVRATDSVFFSYQNKVTGKYPVSTIQDTEQFNMALHVQTNNLPPVTVYAKNYKMDSLANRRDYAKYFNYQKPNPLRNINVANGGVGMDPNDIINLFRFRRNRQLLSLQNRLIQEEQDKYIDYRFNRSFVKKVTGMTDDAAVKRFMFKYRPPYDFLAIVNELELGYYIQQCYKKDQGLLPPGVEIYLLGVQDPSVEGRRN